MRLAHRMRRAASRREMELPDYADLVMELGPVAYWKMDEASGTLAADTQGNFNGAYQNSPTMTGPALRRGAIRSKGFGVLAANTQQVFIGNHPLLGNLAASGNSFTVALWVQAIATPPANARLIQYFTGAFDGTGPWRARFSGVNDIRFDINSSAQALPRISPLLEVGVPEFVVFRKSTDTGMAIFNGDTKSEDPVVRNAGYVAGYGLCFPGVAGYSIYQVRCYMSDVAIFQRALSDAEVLSLYAAGEL